MGKWLLILDGLKLNHVSRMNPWYSTKAWTSVSFHGIYFPHYLLAILVIPAVQTSMRPDPPDYATRILTAVDWNWGRNMSGKSCSHWLVPPHTVYWKNTKRDCKRPIYCQTKTPVPVPGAKAASPYPHLAPSVYSISNVSVYNGYLKQTSGKMWLTSSYDNVCLSECNSISAFFFYS